MILWDCLLCSEAGLGNALARHKEMLTTEHIVHVGTCTDESKMASDITMGSGGILPTGGHILGSCQTVSRRATPGGFRSNSSTLVTTMSSTTLLTWPNCNSVSSYNKLPFTVVRHARCKTKNFTDTMHKPNGGNTSPVQNDTIKREPFLRSSARSATSPVMWSDSLGALKSGAGFAVMKTCPKYGM